MGHFEMGKGKKLEEGKKQKRGKWGGSEGGKKKRNSERRKWK
jgi:hypothetical protein